MNDAERKLLLSSKIEEQEGIIKLLLNQKKVFFPLFA